MHKPEKRWMPASQEASGGIFNQESGAERETIARPLRPVNGAKERQMKRYIAVAYPGQSERVRVGLGRTAWVLEEGAEYARSVSLGWQDRPYPPATHSPEEFLRTVTYRTGGMVETEARLCGLKK